MTPRASFVIPAYNAERWVSKAIYSCRNQTIKQIEIIVVNDASTDGTQEIIDWHAKDDDRVKPIDLQNNAGSGHARNVGSEAAKAEYVLVLDADDLSTRDRVKNTIAAFELKKADLVYGSFFGMDSMGTASMKMISSQFNPELSKKEKLNFICHSTMAYTKALWEKIKYDENEWVKNRMEDWKFQWDAYKAGAKFYSVKSPLCYSRVSEDGQSSLRNEPEILKAKEGYLATL